MDEIKSAAEIAREKLEKIGEPTEEERLRWKFVPEGEKLAAGYLKSDLNLTAELSRYEEKEKKYILEGAVDILVRNIGMPKDEAVDKANRRAMEGLKSLKKDKARVENVYSNLRRIFSHYTGEGSQQKKQAYESLKAEFMAKVQAALQQQTGAAAGFKIDVENQPQFREAWRRLEAQIDSQYLKLLSEYKQALKAIP